MIHRFAFEKKKVKEIQSGDKPVEIHISYTPQREKEEKQLYREYGGF